MAKRKWGDRRDAKLIRDCDSMHFIMGTLWPNRTDNEAFITDTFDLTAVNAYLEKKNAENPEYKYNLFQVIVAAFLKCIVLRPKLNRFYKNGNYYQRNRISTAFIVKKKFEDHAEEGLAVVRAKEEWTIDDVHNDMYRQITKERKVESGNNSTSDAMDVVQKLPRFISKSFVRFVRFLDKHGWVPKSLIASDIFYQTIGFSNLGSIKMEAGYHHLTNWGTCSMVCTIGIKKPRPFYDEAGNVTMKDSVTLGLTIDERIADGYYYSKTMRLLKKLLENPELLDCAFSEEVEEY